jgi:hypothetical protein
MKKYTHGLLLILFTSATAVSVGCSTAPASGSGTGGRPGAGTGGSGFGAGTGGSGNPGVGVAITPSPSGFVAADTNTLMVTGAWFAYGDGYGDGGVVGGKCQMAGHTTCSVITAPPLPPGTAGFPPTAGAMCTSGMVAAVANIVNSNPPAPDYSNIFGAGIGLDLNNPGGANGKGVFNATAKGVTGISFDLDAPPLSGLRVEFPTTKTDGTTAGAEYWGAGPSYPNSPVVAGTNTIHFSPDVKGPGPTATVFDPSVLESIQFHIPTTAAAGASYSFCISNLKLLM